MDYQENRAYHRNTSSTGKLSCHDINRRCEKYLRFFVDIYTKNIYTNYSQKERINKNEV